MPNVRSRIKKRKSSVGKRQLKSRVFAQRKSRQAGRRKTVTASTFLSKFLTILITSLVGVAVLLVVTFFLLMNQTSWDKQGRLTVLLIDQTSQEQLKYPLHILSIDGANREVSMLSLPPQLWLRAMRKYGEFPSDSLFALYQQEQLPYQYVEGTLAYNLGIIVDHRLLTLAIDDDRDLQKVFWRSLFRLNSGSLRWGDRFAIWRMLIEMRDDQFTNISKSYPSLYTLNPSGFAKLNQGLMDTVVAKFFSRPHFVKQSWDIAVINLTQESGVATFWGKRLRQAGFQLINVDSVFSEDEQKSSTIYLSKRAANDPEVVQTLKSLFPVDLEFASDDSIIQRYRSDVVVFIAANIVDEYPDPSSSL